MAIKKVQLPDNSTQDINDARIASTDITAWNGKQDTLVSGENIKTVNNQSLLGGGNVSIVGEKGDIGPAGITPSLSIGTVATLSPGASATATITGTSAQPVLNLGIPQGSQGNSGYSGTDTLELVNNLTDGGTTSALTAEQGKVLKALIDANSASLDELWDEISEGEAMFTNENNIRLITLSISGDVYDSMSLYAIKQLSTVTAVMDDNTSSAVTDFTLSGITQAGPQVFTATYDTFKASTSKTVLVRTSTLLSISAVCSVSEVSLYSELDELRQYLTVSKVYADTTTEATEDYTLSGTITSSSSTITVTYNPDPTKTTTFTVTGVSDGSYVQNSLSSMVDFSQYEDNYTGDILDEVSGNAISLSGSLAVAATKAPYGGLHNGMLVMCRWNVGVDYYGLAPTLAGSSPAAPLTLEFYGRLRAPYEVGGTTPTIGTLSSSLYRVCIFDSSATNTNKFTIRFANSGEISFFGPVAMPNVLTSGAAIPFYDSSHTSVKDLTHIVVCMQTSHTWIYVNGTLITESTSGTYDCLGGGDLAWFSDESYVAADICMLRTYSKVLNAGEVERNYQNCVGIWGTTME